MFLLNLPLTRSMLLYLLHPFTCRTSKSVIRFPALDKYKLNLLTVSFNIFEVTFYHLSFLISSEFCIVLKFIIMCPLRIPKNKNLCDYLRHEKTHYMFLLVQVHLLQNSSILREK